MNNDRKFLHGEKVEGCIWIRWISKLRISYLFKQRQRYTLPNPPRPNKHSTWRSCFYSKKK